MLIQAVTEYSQFVSTVEREINYRQILQTYQTHYNLRKFKITEIPTESALQLFQHIVQKFYKSHNPGESGTWVENQLRLYLWTVICYMEINRKNLMNLDKQDWDFFARIFYVKQYSLFEYQARILLDETIKISKWSDQEDYMLYCIIIKDKSAKWNQIAKSLFINSNKQYLRASKQCRQRWLNHLDPSKSKSEWSLKQYLLMFEQIEQKGKKWAILVKILKDRRSQHSIKNKYNSIIKKQQRLTPQLNQLQICRQMSQKITRILETHQIQPNDQYIFGCSLKLLAVQNKNKMMGDGYDKRISRASPEELQMYRSKFQIFRKKIQKFQCLNEPQKYKTQTKPNKKSVFMKQLTLTAPSKLKREVEMIQQIAEPSDQIFYDQSFQVDELRHHQYSLFNEDLKNLINERDLDL